MPEALLHFAVVFTVSAPIIGLRRALLASIISLAPDLDALFLIHRSITHSLVVIFPAVLISLAVSYRIKLGQKTVLASGLALISHPILDLFQTYTPILYPLSPFSYHVNMAAAVTIANEISPHITYTVKAKPPDFTPSPVLDAPLFTTEGFIISVILVATPLMYQVLKKKPVEIKIKTTHELGRAEYPEILDLPQDNPCPHTLSEKVTVVLPTLNEEEAIRSVIHELRECGFQKILVVDGYSSDRTVEIARELGVPVIMQNGPGKAGAIKTAIEKVSTEYVVFMDCDGTYPPSQIHKLLEHAKDYDMVIGARKNGRENIPKLNRFGNWVISKIFKLLFAKPITDVCSGMYLIKTEKARQLEITTTSFDVEVEIASQIASKGRITEVPITYRKRLGKQKLNPIKHGLRIISTLIWMANYYNPVILYGMIVALAAIPATAILTWVAYENIFNHVWHSGYALFGVMLLLLAAQGGAVVVTSLLIKRVEQRIKEDISKLSKNLETTRAGTS